MAGAVGLATLLPGAPVWAGLQDHVEPLMATATIVAVTGTLLASRSRHGFGWNVARLLCIAAIVRDRDGLPRGGTHTLGLLQLSRATTTCSSGERLLARPSLPKAALQHALWRGQIRLSACSAISMPPTLVNAWNEILNPFATRRVRSGGGAYC